MSSAQRWALYGAYGYTGRLIVQEAVERGHRPLLVGRNPERLRKVAEEAELEWEPARVQELGRVLSRLEPGSVLLNAAGPFTRTAERVLGTCLDHRLHYLDITAEVPVLEALFKRDAEARRQQITAVPAVAFHVVSSDALAYRLHEAVRVAVRLELGFRGAGGPSAGTLKTMLEHLPRGALRRRGGVLIRGRVGEGGRMIPFSGGAHYAIPATWGDLSTAYRTTEIRDIVTYMALSRGSARRLRILAPVLRSLLSVPALRGAAQTLVGIFVQKPAGRRSPEARSRIWGRVEAPDGRTAWARMETEEGYRFTAMASVRGVERILEGVEPGVLTPTQAFGAPFAEEIPGTEVMGPFPGEPEPGA